MSQIKIFVDCHVFDGGLQGTTTYLKGLYTELIKDKTKLFYLASCNNDSLKLIFGEHENINYLQYKFHNKFFRLLFNIPQLIRKNKIDFAHFQYVVPPIKKCKYIVTIHDVLFLEFPDYFPLKYRVINNFLFKSSAKYSDIVLTVSEYSKKQIQKHFNISNVSITPNAVDPIFFETFNKKEIKELVKNKFNVENYFLYVSRLEPRKNHDMLLKVFVENKLYKNHFLVFIGNQAIPNKAYITYYENLEDSIKNKIITLSKVNFEDMLQLVRGATLSVYPSIAEGFGIPPLESLAANVPTICSNTTAMSDFDFMGDCLFDPLDANDLYKKIEIGLNDENSNEKRIIVSERFNWKVAAAEFQKTISHII